MPTLARTKTVSAEDAPKCAEVKRLYEKWGNADGTLDNVLTIHSCNPRAMEAHFQLYNWSVGNSTQFLSSWSQNREERPLGPYFINAIDWLSYEMETILVLPCNLKFFWLC